MGMKLKLYRNVTTLASIKIVFLFLLLTYFGCYGNFKFPFTCNGKNENWYHDCYLVADILAEVFQKCLLSSPLRYNFCPNC